MLNQIRRRLRREIPAVCWLCASRCDSGMLCQACYHSLTRNRTACRCCAEPLAVAEAQQGATDNLICGRCQRNPPAFNAAFAPFLYHYPLADLIQRFKQRDDLLLGRLLVSLLCEGASELALMPQVMPDLIVPVPTHWRRRLQRGVNPAAVLAEGLGCLLERPADLRCLRKVVHTPAQHQLNREQRLVNLQHSIRLQRPGAVNGRHIALVDDVMTTGSTAGVIAGLLRDNGALSVQVWALARTPPQRLQHYPQQG